MNQAHTIPKANSLVSLLPWLMCGIAALFYCYEYLLRIAPSAMESELMQAYSIEATGVGLISAFYFFAYTPMQLPVGIMMDKFGPRRILTLAAFCCAIGVACFALTTIFHLALLGRFLIGFGSAFAFVGVLKLASIWLPPDRFAFIAGSTTALGMLGAMIGQNTLELTISQVGVDRTMLGACVIGLCLIPIVWLVVRDGPKHAPAPITSTTCQSMLQDLALVFKNSQIWTIGLVGAFIMLPTTVFAELWGRLFFKIYYGFESSTATWATSMIFLGWAVGGPIAGFISDTFHRRVLPLAVGAGLGTLIMLAIIYGPIFSQPILFFMLFSFGVVSSVEVICFATARENARGNLAGTAVAMTNFIVVLAGFCQWLVGKLLDFSRQGAVDANDHPLYSIVDFQFALILLPLSMILGFILCFFVNETYCKPVHGD